MRNLKSSFGVFGALVPIVYCVGLLYYFLDLSGSMQEAKDTGLGPTMLGLSAVGLLFSVPFIIKVVRMLARSGSAGPGGRGGPDAPTGDGEGEFDPEAAVARYMARRSAEAAAPSPAAPPKPPAQKSSEPASPPSFGRRRR